MDAFREVVIAQTEEVTVHVPPRFINRKLEIILLPCEDEPSPVTRSLLDLAGRLRWKGDAVAEQRRLRDELSIFKVETEC